MKKFIILVFLLQFFCFEAKAQGDLSYEDMALAILSSKYAVSFYRQYKSSDHLLTLSGFKRILEQIFFAATQDQHWYSKKIAAMKVAINTGRVDLNHLNSEVQWQALTDLELISPSPSPSPSSPSSFSSSSSFSSKTSTRYDIQAGLVTIDGQDLFYYSRPEVSSNPTDNDNCESSCSYPPPGELFFCA